ncbi:MAG: dTMP kinase [Deltaproteobacteria bacterium]|nr:MAG: dTMP kinase [Deltaproteobacteria bacterium]
MALFVTFEGIEGSGKSTHLRLLADHLRAAGHPVVETREPGGTAAGAAIRRLLLGTDAPPLSPLSELLLYCADRTEHVSIVIRPALAAGQVVLSDRFSESTIAYQSYGRGLDLTVVRTLDAHARAGLVPHLTFLLDCPASEGLRRIAGRHASSEPGGAAPKGAAPLPLDRFERETLAFHERVRDGFRTLAAAEPTRFCVIDASAPVETIRARIAAEADRRLAKAA